MATSAPGRARPRAIDLPIRRDPPVTRAVRPARLMRTGGTTESVLSVSEIGGRMRESTGAGAEKHPARAATIHTQPPDAGGRTGSNADRGSGRCVASRGGDVRPDPWTSDERSGDAREHEGGHRNALGLPQRIRAGRPTSNTSMTTGGSFRTIRRDSFTIFIVAHLACRYGCYRNTPWTGRHLSMLTTVTRFDKVE